MSEAERSWKRRPLGAFFNKYPQSLSQIKEFSARNPNPGHSPFSAFDLEAHIPVICDFWEQQLFGRPGYGGRAFEAHAALHRHTAITPHHFHRWLYLFAHTVDEGFAGPMAEAVKGRAGRIAASMREGLERFETENASEAGVRWWEAL